VRRWVLAAAALLLAGQAFAIRTERLVRARPAAVGGGTESVEVMSGQVFAKLSATADKAAIAASLGGAVIQDNPLIGWTLFSLPAGMPVSSGISALSHQPGVLAVDGNRAYHINAIPSDPDVSSQYGLQRINAFNAWDLETGSTNKVTIAVIDSGIDGTSQPDVDGKLVGTSQFFDPDSTPTGTQSADNPPTAACNHATLTASVAAASANNGSGIAGVSWGAKLISLKVINGADCDSRCGGTNCGSNDQTIIKAIDYVRTTLVPASATFGRLVINISLGGAGSCSAALQSAMNNAVAAGVPIIVSAGNDGGAVNSPANCATSAGGSGIIPAGASDSNDQIAYFSSHGPELAANGVLAPGVNIFMDNAGGGTTTESGTSFSAPHVAGVAALLLSAKPTLTPKQVQACIIGGSDNTGLTTQSTSSGDGGRLDAYRALLVANTGSAGNASEEQHTIAYPNPFRPAQASMVTFTIPSGTTGTNRTINIYSAAGEHVRTSSSLTWDGKNDQGTLVASGVYLYTIKIDNTVLRGRVAVIR